MEQHQFGLREWADLCERKDATIAALQARVQELEDDRSAWKEIAQDWSAAAKLAEQPEKFYEGYSAAVMNAMQALLTKARAQLTQRTAERDTARRRVDELEAREVDVVLLRDDLEKRTAELERVRKKLGETKLYLQQERANRDSLVACVNRDVKTIKELRALILALPKVEGDDAAALVYGSWWRKGGNEQQFDAALSALLQHRQGMEG